MVTFEELLKYLFSNKLENTFFMISTVIELNLIL